MSDETNPVNEDEVVDVPAQVDVDTDVASEEPVEVKEEVEEKPKKRPGRPKGSKAKTKEKEEPKVEANAEEVKADKPIGERTRVPWSEAVVEKQRPNPGGVVERQILRRQTEINLAETEAGMAALRRRLGRT